MRFTLNARKMECEECGKETIEYHIWSNGVEDFYLCLDCWLEINRTIKEA